ncbi:MAG TPA: response regulator transcription factor [Gemmatimonadaceae bacterium]|nr:response regulator transcription factor [Gemmatimonadaceae bacterium]
MGKNRMAIRVFLANSRVILLDSLQVLLEIQQDIRIVGKATNGHDAVRKIRKLRPDVAILDVELAGLNGIEASLKIAGLSPSTAIVMLATTASPEFIFRALRAGARGYLSREASGLELVDAVRTIREGKRYLSPKITATLIGDYISEHRSPSPLESLTSRERNILQLVVEGSSSAQVADILSFSPKTVDTYRSRIKQKLGIHDLPALVKFAIQHGITSIE